MRLSYRMMADSDHDLGGVKRSPRNDWAQGIEPLIRSLSPFPISYDVDSTQTTGFTEYSYTEFLGGIYINTQSVEINTRLIQEASKVPCKTSNLDRLIDMGDKYSLEPLPAGQGTPRRIAFMVGHNAFDLVSPEIMARAAHEHNDFYVKLHPLTNFDYASKVAALVGWDRVIDGSYSGAELLAKCDEAYVSTATEFCALAVAMGKPIHNISSFFNESSGVYYPINRLLFQSDNPQETLSNILECDFSGIIFPWTENPEEKIRKYYEKSQELRNIYRPLASPSRLTKEPANP